LCRLGETSFLLSAIRNTSMCAKLLWNFRA
jgi:hypothetical protein